MAEYDSLRFGDLELELRRSVARRVRRLDDRTIVYLSLLDEEIDARLDDFVAKGADATFLELTDAVILAPDEEYDLRVLRGACCTFPLYRRNSGRRAHVATHLPVASGAPLSATGLLDAVASAGVQGSFEANALTSTPISGWSRLRRGALTTFVAGTWRDEPILQAFDIATETEIVAMLRAAFDGFSRSQRAVRRSVVELSGGYDSTIAAAAALSSGHEMLGASVEFPFYEFRLEADVQRTTGASLGIHRRVLDGTDLFPYAPWSVPPRFDEPSVFVTGIRHAEAVGELARLHQATRIYTGHGGDGAFAADLTENEEGPSRFSRTAFSSRAWRAIRTACGSLEHPHWLRRSIGCHLYDARQDVWAKERFGTTVRTPFTDRNVFRAALAWSAHCRNRAVRPDKTILRRSVPHLLPASVVGRRGKVAYDGVWMRGLTKNADHICTTLEKAAAVLERIGFSPGWLVKRTRALARWQPVGTRELLAGYAIATWLVAWNIDRASAVSTVSTIRR